MFSMIDLYYFLGFSFILFFVSIVGIIMTRKNIIIILMSLELMLLSINFNFIVFSLFLDDILGQLFSLYILTVAAAETSIGLAILVVYYRIRGLISIENISMLKG